MSTCPSDPRLRVGSPRSVCRGCDRAFASVSAFEAHRAGPPGDRYCLDPADIVTKAGEPRFRLGEDGLWRGAGSYRP